MNAYRDSQQETGALEQGTWTEEQRSEIKKLIGESLDRAEKIWKEVGHEFEEEGDAETRTMLVINAAVSTLIPDHEEVEIELPQVSDFTAFVLDIRDSTKHLLELRAVGQTGRLERVLYETFGLLPACSRVLEYHGGRTTEYLGDGILGLFHAPIEPAEKRDASLEEATRAGWKCLDVRCWVNEELARRYSLPTLDLGIGISWSKAIVTVVGHNKKNTHGKAIGECVFRASKMAGGRNEMYTDKKTRDIWPSKKGGILLFQPRKMGGEDGYLLERKS